jgi:GNAT superfamily N-acetyltransferase
VSVGIREATGDDWPAMWAFMQGIIRAGETFSWDTETDEATARRQWMNAPPGRTFVAAADDGTVLGTAEMGPNHGGPAAHVASAGFMVDPRHSGQGVGRRLGEHVLDQARADGYRAMQFNAVVECNAPAVSLWRSLGFEVLATVPDGFRHPVEGDVGLLIMYRRL